MSEIVQHINQLNNQLQQLLKQYELLKKENAKNRQQLETLQAAQAEQLQKIDELHQQNLLLKASLTDMDGADKKALEQKISYYVKNIDKCISLLSK
ncbi:MAG: hypothetical protein EOO88_25050 [Pedobacter sp.]|nr:MAG: hypothetical protein EOO88_25050 [Pedobacter sp.]